MRSSPAFTAAAVLVLAIGIGATVAAFSAFNMVALRPLLVRDPETLVRLGRHSAERSASDIPYPAVAFYREHSRTLSAVLAQTESELSLDGVDGSSSTAFVTVNFFDELGARPAQGRLLRTGDDVSCTIRESTVGSWPDQKSSVMPDEKWTSPDRITQRG